MICDMTIKISLSPALEDKLKERAAASGQDVAVVAAELIEQAIAGNGGTALDLSPEQRAAEWRSWAENHPRLGHSVDDSRQSIYRGRGE